MTLIDAELAGMKVGDLHPTRVMGVINLSEESFYKGSIVSGNQVAEKASMMVEEGADILDIGARSTAPGVKPISVQEEGGRLLPALKSVLEVVDVPVSVDTQYANIAKKSLSAGAQIINDISGLKNDPDMVMTASDFDALVILMATKKVPGDCLTFSETRTALVESIGMAEDGGITDIVIDPGIGRWVPEKTYECDLALLNSFERFRVLGRPVLVAVSRKSFISGVLSMPDPSDRLAGTLACTAIAVCKGAHIVRTHDVKETMDTVKMAKAVQTIPIAVEKDGYQVVIIDCIKEPEDSTVLMRSIGVTDTGVKIMKDKTVSTIMFIKNVAAPEALVLKQEMLARGGDAAIHSGAISGEMEMVDVLLFGTVAQIKSLIHKLRMQSLNLPMIGDLIQEALQKDGNR